MGGSNARWREIMVSECVPVELYEIIRAFYGFRGECHSVICLLYERSDGRGAGRAARCFVIRKSLIIPGLCSIVLRLHIGFELLSLVRPADELDNACIVIDVLLARTAELGIRRKENVMETDHGIGKVDECVRDFVETVSVCFREVIGSVLLGFLGLRECVLCLCY